MVKMEERHREVGGLTLDLAASELRQQLEFILACQVCRVFFRQPQEEYNVSGYMSQVYLAQ